MLRAFALLGLLEVLWQGMHTHCISRMALSIWQASFCKAQSATGQQHGSRQCRNQENNVPTALS